MVAKDRLFLYSVIRYVPDPVRDEAVNVGVIMRSEEKSSGKPEFYYKVVEDYSKFRRVPAVSLLKEAVRKLVSEYKPTETLQSLSKRMEHKIRLTEPRAILVDNADGSIKQLFDSFVSMLPRHRVERPFPTRVREKIWEMIIGVGGQKKHPLCGKYGRHTFDYTFKNKDDMFIDVINFSKYGGPDAVKVFDWNAIDFMKVLKYGPCSFILVMLIQDDSDYKEIGGHHLEAERILKARGYQFITLMEDGTWERDLDAFISRMTVHRK